MSLINDAFHEAQREANRRRKESQPALLGEDPFPAPTRVVVERHGPTSRVIRNGAIAFLVVASAIATGIVTYGRVKSNVAPTPTRTDTAVMPVSPAPVNVAVIPPRPASKAPIDTPKPITSSTARGAATSAATNRPVSVPAPRREAAREVESKPAGLRMPPTAPPKPVGQEPVATLPSQPRPTNDNLRVVVEPISLRAGDSLFARAFAEHTRGNLDAAADLYERALNRPPVSPELYNDYGALLATRGKHAAAIAMYNLGIAANDQDARLWANLGDSYRATSRRADAMSAYFEAAKLDPSNITVKLRLAAEYASLGDTAGARRGFEEAVRAAPNDAEPHYRYGAFLQSQHDNRAAIRELQSFVDLAAGRYPQDVIDRTRAFVASLRRQTP